MSLVRRMPSEKNVSDGAHFAGRIVYTAMVSSTPARSIPKVVVSWLYFCMNPRISIVIPVFNERESLRELYAEIVSAFAHGSVEVVFVDDGSTDDSFAQVRALYHSSRGSRCAVRGVRFRRNRGKAAALSAGFRRARGEFVATLDADLQDDPAEILPMIEHLGDQYDLVSGWKRERHDPFLKTFHSRLFNWVVRVTTGVALHDVNCGLKVYRSEVVRNLHLYGDLHRFIPVLAAGEGFRVGERVVRHRKRKYGSSKYGPGRIVRGLLDLLTVKVVTKYFRRPAHFFGGWGALFLLVGVVADGYVTFLKLTTGTTQGKVPLLIFGVLMITVGVQLVSLGLLGELVVRGREKQEDGEVFIAEELGHE